MYKYEEILSGVNVNLVKCISNANWIFDKNECKINVSLFSNDRLKNPQDLRAGFEGL